MSSWQDGGERMPPIQTDLKDWKRRKKNSLRLFLWYWTTDCASSLLDFLTPVTTPVLQRPSEPPSLTLSGWKSKGSHQDLHIILNYFYQKNPTSIWSSHASKTCLRASVSFSPVTPGPLTASASDRTGLVSGFVAYWLCGLLSSAKHLVACREATYFVCLSLHFFTLMHFTCIQN